MNRFKLGLETLDGRDMPSATLAMNVFEANVPDELPNSLVTIQRNGGLAGSIEGRSAVVTGALPGGVTGDRFQNVDVFGGLYGGVVLGGLRGGVVLGALPGGVTMGIPVDSSEGAQISARGSTEEIPQHEGVNLDRARGEEIPSFMSINVDDEPPVPGEEIPT